MKGRIKRSKSFKKQEELEFNEDRLFLNLILVIIGFSIGIFLVQEDYLIVLSCLALLLVVIINDGNLFIPKENGR